MYKDFSGCTHQDGPLQIGVDTAKHELPHNSGDGWEDQSATQDPCGRHVVRQGAGLCRDTRNWAANPCRDAQTAAESQFKHTWLYLYLRVQMI